MRCPFCTGDMRSGTIRMRALRHIQAAVDWEPDLPAASRRRWRNLVFDPQAGHTRPVLGPGDLDGGHRAASYCDGCGTVVAHPRDRAVAPPE
jgi:hypothetical protein